MNTKHNSLFFSKSNNFSKNNTISELFEFQVERSPDKVALVFEDQELTYQQLNEKSNQLARYIRSEYTERTGKELKADTLIALFLDRSLEMIIGILGVLKAGGAYVPIDTTYPQERIDYLLEDTKAELILSQSQLRKNGKMQLPEDKLVLIGLDEAFYRQHGTSNLPAHSKGQDLAYVIYTSGTTGRPKGVMQMHHNVIRLFKSSDKVFGFNDRDVWTLFHSYVFDFSVWELWGALIFGGKLVIVPKEHTKDLQQFYNSCLSNKVTVLNQTPSVFYQFLQIANQSNQTDLNLRYVIFGGEALNTKQLQPWWDNQSSLKTKLINMYGITETTVHVTYKEITENETVASNIGQPLNDLQAYVLDENFSQVPVGVSGELYISGAGLARGYLNNEELTAQRFVPNPFATAQDQEEGYTRLYKTGDVVRRIIGGGLEYIGRNDDQVKIRGHRIEIGEVEYALSAIAGIKQSCVLAKERASRGIISKYLAGYFVLNEDQKGLSADHILEQLAVALPSYMVPSILTELTDFPLTINGKLDKKALPEPIVRVLAETYIAPTTPTEIKICEIWGDVLGIPQIGITENFFRIGGDSILSIQVSSRLQQKGHNCQVRDIYKSKTVAKLAEFLDNKESKVPIKSEQGLLEGGLDLLPVQEWFADRVNDGKLAKPNHWNQSFIIKVSELETSLLFEITKELVNHHDALRIRFEKGNEWQQAYQTTVDIPELLTLDVSGRTSKEIHQVLTNWQSCFDLENGPMFQMGYLFGYEDNTARVFFAAHHIIIDSVSWRILAEDIKALYSGKTLPQKGSSYRQWIQTVKAYPAQHPEEDIYWSGQLQGMPDYKQAQNEASHIQYNRSIKLNEELTNTLLRVVPKTYHTEVNDLLLTVLVYALKDVNGSDSQGITLEGHGRESIDPTIDHNRTVGWFTSMFPVKLEVQKTIKESIQFTKETLRKIPNKGLGFGAFASSKETDYSLKDLLPISFNYLGQFDTKQGDWQITANSRWLDVDPSNVDHNFINVTGMVIDSKLEFSIVTRLGEDTTKLLAKSFEKHLYEIIDHCTNKLKSEGSSYTPSDFEHVKVSQHLLDRLQSEARSSENSIANIYPANSLQQGFIYHSLSQKEDLAYRQQYMFEYHEPIDVNAYISATKMCVAQYPILRTAFNWEEGLVQIIYEKGFLNHKFYDFSNLSSQDAKNAEIEKIRLEVRRRDFDLSKPTLLRLHIIKQSDDFYTVIKTVHHIVTEGWSETILMNSVHQHYKSLIAHKKVTVKEDTAYLEAQDFISSNKNKLSTYWEGVLEEVEGANDITALLSEPVDLSIYKRVIKPRTIALEVKEDFYNKLKTLSQSEGITINVITQFIWHKLIQVYSGSNKSVVGTIVSGRNLPVFGIEDSVGLYINTLPLVVDWNKEETILCKLQQIQNQLTELTMHSFVDLVNLQNNGERLFHSLLIYQNFPKLQGHGIDFRLNHHYHDGMDYPLCIQANEQEGQFTIYLKYDGNCLSEEKATHHIETLKHLLDQVVTNPHQLHNELELLNPSEYNQLVYDWNETDKEYPQEKTIHQLFEEQVAKNPESVALVCEGEELTYRQLNEKSNQLARQIRKEYKKRAKEELKPDTLIPLFLDRSPEMIIGILGVLKAGGAYVPIDITYPQTRLDYLLDDTKAQLVVTQQHLIESQTTTLPLDKIINIDLNETFYKSEDVSNLAPCNKSKDLAYVIYTSGTTGKPKGVMLEHFSLCNRVQHIISFSEISPADFHLFKTNYVFDASFFEIFTHLLVGARLQITRYLFDLIELQNLLQSKEITSLHLVPSQFELVSSAINTVKPSKIFFSGEALTAKILTSLDQDIKAYNYYGPTELGEITGSNSLASEKIPVIGKIFPNSRHYVLDSNKTPVPIGVLGELYVGGAGLARGYLNDESLTSDRFVPNHFATEADQALGYTRLYKTGDLVRWLPDGNLEYVGRNDDQVKIRGIRVELAEVEQVLTEVKGINQSCILVKKRETETGFSKYLVGYYTLENVESNLNQEDIFKRISSVLPDQMVPDYLVRLDSFPLTGNGKLDKKALPNPELGSSEEDYVAPTKEIEIIGCKIWKELLGIERVGITDNFFRIGGNSISAIQVSHRMSQVLNSDVRVADVFKHKTIAQLLAYSLGQAQISIPKTEENGTVLSFSQERLWFIDQFEEGTNLYHLPWVVELDEATDKTGICYALEQVVMRHEVLRSTVEKGDDQRGFQKVHSRPLLIEEAELLPTGDLQAIIKLDISRQFDISREYPIRVKFYKETTGRVVLVVNFHHIACDGWSIDIFRSELLAYYEAYVQGDTGFSLPPLTIQYKDYALWQRTYLTGEVLENQVTYWKEKLSGYETLALPTDYVRPPQVNYQGSEEYFTIKKGTSDKLRALAKVQGTTVHSVLLSSVNILLGNYAGQEDIVVGSPIANRQYHQTAGLIGFFVNTQVNRTILSTTQSYSELIDTVHHEQVASQLHQDLPFEKLVDELGIDRDLSRHPIFQVMFGVQSFGSSKENGQKEYFKPFEGSVSVEVSKFDLSMFIDDSGEELEGRISYSTSLFGQSTITGMLAHYQHLLDQLVTSPDQAYSQISMLDTSEYEKIVLDWNATHKEYPRDKKIHELFEVQVAYIPDHVALVFDLEELTYRELNEKSNQLARHIRSHYEQRTGQALQPDTLIGLCLDRSLEMVIGILGVLKAGGASVPMNPDHPQERIDYLLNDTEAELILTQKQLSESIELELPADKVLPIDLEEALYKELDTSNLSLAGTSTDLAYVIYTSGTTGKPKGVMLEHGGIVNKLSWMRSTYSLGTEDVLLQKTPYTFDVSIWELLLANTSGAKLVLAKPEGHKDSGYLHQLIQNNQVSMLHFVPSMLEVYHHYLSEQDTTFSSSLKHLLCSGEALTKQQVGEAYTKADHVDFRVYNQYGPTEASITFSEVISGEDVSIGRPIQNTQMYVLDSTKLSVPVGVIGELYIGGAGLARGYLHNEELTSDCFIANPFATPEDKEKGYTRLYKSGDLVRWLSAGNLEYIGRNDDQVKIRGYRVELGEIEYALSEIEGIKQSSVLVKERETSAGLTQYLVGYYVVEPSSDNLTQDGILDKLTMILPDHMVPDALVSLERFPVTANGKLDKQALPDPELGSTEETYVAPTTETELMICKIWEEVLGLERVGITDNFFRIGGNSILAIQVSHRMSQAVDGEVKVADIFVYSTISKLIPVQVGDNNDYDFGVI